MAFAEFFHISEIININSFLFHNSEKIWQNSHFLLEYAYMIERVEYLKKLNDFKEKELIKVITGLRRSGKSILMDQFIDLIAKKIQ